MNECMAGLPTHVSSLQIWTVFAGCGAVCVPARTGAMQGPGCVKPEVNHPPPLCSLWHRRDAGVVVD
jgi:hypothetical protein